MALQMAHSALTKCAKETTLYRSIPAPSALPVDYPMLHFDWPWLFLVLPLPWLARVLLPAAEERGEAVLRIPVGGGLNLPYVSAYHNRRHTLFTMIVATLVWILLVLAACRPHWLGDPVALPISGRNLLLAVDISGSMEVKDFQLRGHRVDRLTAIKHVAGDFIQRRKGDRLGLILFGRNAYLQAPLTFDRKTVQTFLDEAVIGLAGKETAIGDAIALAIKKMALPPAHRTDRPIMPGAHPRRPQPTSPDQVLILLTDGANTAGHIAPMKAAHLATYEKLKIYTIGIGADEMLIASPRGDQRVDPSIDLDEKALIDIAAMTGGRYFRARDTAALEQIYHMLDQLEPTQGEPLTFYPTQAMFMWPLGLALLLAYGLVWQRTKMARWMVPSSRDRQGAGQ